MLLLPSDECGLLLQFPVIEVNSSAQLGARPPVPPFSSAAPTSAPSDTFGATGVAPATGPGGVPWNRPAPSQPRVSQQQAPGGQQAGGAGVKGVSSEEWSALAATVHHTADLVHTAGLGQAPPALPEMQRKSAAAVQMVLQQAVSGISQLCGEGSSSGGKHYVRELRRRVSIVTSELRDREAALGELMQHDWAQALSQSKAQTRQLQAMLLDKQRELEDAQKAIVSKFVVAADRGSADEAQLHAFVSEQAREVRLICLCLLDCGCIYLNEVCASGSLLYMTAL